MGRTTSHRVTCSVCGGSGEITKGKKTETCKACKGKGFHVVTETQKDRDPKPGEWE